MDRNYAVFSISGVIMYYVYIVESDKGKRYIGQTNDLKRRLVQHNTPSKYSYWTKRGKNWRLIHREEVPTRTEAIKREKQLKKLKGKLDKVLNAREA